MKIEPVTDETVATLWYNVWHKNQTSNVRSIRETSCGNSGNVWDNCGGFEFSNDGRCGVVVFYNAQKINDFPEFGTVTNVRLDSDPSAKNIKVLIPDPIQSKRIQLQC